jgi:acetyl-CoA C-acetyltransferase
MPVNFAAAQVMSGQQDLADRRRRRIDEPRRHRRLAAAPGRSIRRSRSPHYFMPQGVSADLIATKYGFSRDDVDAYARAVARSARRPPGTTAASTQSVAPVKDINGLTLLDQRRAHAAGHRRCRSLGQLEAVASR